MVFGLFGLFVLVQGKTRTPRGARAGLPLPLPLPLPWAGVRTAFPRGDTWHVGCLSWHWVRPERHVALGLAFLALSVSQARAPTWGYLAPGLPSLALGQTKVPHGTEAGLPLQ